MNHFKGFALIIIVLTLVPMVNGGYVPYKKEYGIYHFDIETKETSLVYSSHLKITNIDLSPKGDEFALCIYHGDGYEYSEIYTMKVEGTGLTRLTNNTHWDLYPIWSPDGSHILFLSWRNETLDIYLMDQNGEDQRLFYDSGRHDADIDWVDDFIVFTRDSQIWYMNSEGTMVTQLTDPSNAGVWGDAVLPFGDYDPRISPDGSKVVFERLVDDETEHGNYELFIIKVDGTGEHNITDTRWTQGIAQWSRTGEELVYLVSAMGLEGRYDIFRVNVDGTKVTDLTSEVFPPGFLAQHPIYAENDSTLYFVGQWYGWERRESAISLQELPGEVELGDQVSIEGNISPEVRDIQFVYKVTMPDGVERTGFIDSSDGSFSYPFDASMVGDWEISFEWTGDIGYEAASSRVFITVSEVVEQTEFIPSYPVIAICTGIFLFVLFIRKLSTRVRGFSIFSFCARADLLFSIFTYL